MTYASFVEILEKTKYSSDAEAAADGLIRPVQV